MKFVCAKCTKDKDEEPIVHRNFRNQDVYTCKQCETVKKAKVKKVKNEIKLASEDILPDGVFGA